jgi:hypothetical protein
MCKLAFSQNIEVFDKILAIPIENVNVKSNQKGVITNSKGVCAINKFKENDTLIISHIAYHQIQIIKSTAKRSFTKDSSPKSQVFFPQLVKSSN